jgi:hypothetical protein
MPGRGRDRRETAVDRSVFGTYTEKMRRRRIYLLVLAAWELIRLYIVASYAVETGRFDFLPTCVYALAPEAVFAAAFFFLWLDFTRFRVFRELLIAAKAVSLAAAAIQSVSVLADYRAKGAYEAIWALLSLRPALIVGAADAAAIVLLAIAGGKTGKAAARVPEADSDAAGQEEP